jgi:hypothetical protein
MAIGYFTELWESDFMNHSPKDTIHSKVNSANTNTAKVLCSVCGEPMPEGEEMFKFHGYSGNCPKPPLPTEPKKTYEQLKSELTTLTEENAVLKSRTNDLQSRTEELAEAAQGLVKVLEYIAENAVEDGVFAYASREALTTWKQRIKK